MHAVNQIIERFPDFDDRVRRLYLRDEVFRAICDDFVLSLAALRRFEARTDAPIRPEVADYRDLLRDLEKELGDYLAKRETPSG